MLPVVESICTSLDR